MRLQLTNLGHFSATFALLLLTAPIGLRANPTLLEISPTVASHSPITRAQYVNKAYQHINRVQYEMFVAYKEFPEYFSSLTPRLVEMYGALHDLPKVLSLEELRPWGYTLRYDIATYLAYFYGKNIEDMPPAEEELFREVRRQLNEIEAKIKTQLFYGILKSINPHYQVSHIKEQIEKLEMWADITDTRLYRREEINIQGSYQIGESGQFLVNNLRQDIRALRVSRFLELHMLRPQKPNCFSVLGQVPNFLLLPAMEMR